MPEPAGKSYRKLKTLSHLPGNDSDCDVDSSDNNSDGSPVKERYSEKRDASDPDRDDLARDRSPSPTDNWHNKENFRPSNRPWGSSTFTRPTRPTRPWNGGSRGVPFNPRGRFYRPAFRGFTRGRPWRFNGVHPVRATGREFFPGGVRFYFDPKDSSPRQHQLIQQQSKRPHQEHTRKFCEQQSANKSRNEEGPNTCEAESSQIQVSGFVHLSNYG